MRDGDSGARHVRTLWWLVGLLLLLRLVAMAAMPLMDTTEGRYAEIGRKMAEWGDWVTPWHDQNVPFWGKPPLSFWLTALSFKLLGFNEFAARLPHLLCSIGAAACIWNAARQRSGTEGAIAVALMASSLLFFLGGAAVMTDLALILGTTMGLCSAWLAMTGSTPQQRRLHGWLAFVGGAIGLMAKGPLALVLLGGPLVVWALWCGHAMTLWRALPWVRGTVLMAVLVVPWFIIAERKTPGFIEYFIVGEHFHRFVTPGWTGDLYGNAHQQPKGTIWLYAAGAMAPWTVLVPALALWRRWRGAGDDGASGWAAAAPARAPQGSAHSVTAHPVTEVQTDRLVAIAALLPLLFFTASSNIIWTYALPALPAAAWWTARWMGRNAPQGLRWTVAGTAVALVILAAGLVVAEQVGRFKRGSGQGLVQACESVAQRRAPQALADESRPIVVVLGRRSLSADYYARGRSPQVPDLQPLLENWPAEGQCLAFQVHDEPTVKASGLVVLEDLGRLHERRVLWVAPPAGQGPR